MKNNSRHTNEGISFSAKITKARMLLTMAPLSVAARPMRKKKPWTGYVGFLFAGPGIWRWRKYALFPRGGTGEIFKDLL